MEIVRKNPLFAFTMGISFFFVNLNIMVYSILRYVGVEPLFNLSLLLTVLLFLIIFYFFNHFYGKTLNGLFGEEKSELCHEVNNSLTIATGNLYRLNKKLSGQEEDVPLFVREHLRKIEKAHSRIEFVMEELNKSVPSFYYSRSVNEKLFLK